MSTLQEPKAKKPGRRWKPAQYGLIGVDIGFRETKVAQIARRGHEQRITASWRFPVSSGDGAVAWEDFEQTIDGVVAEVATLQPLFHGSRIAFSLPFDQTPLRLVDVPRGDEAEMRSMIREELATEFDEEEICFDYWDTSASGRSEQSVAQLAVVMVSAQRSQWAAQRFVDSGFDCRVLDSGLCAMARAAHLSLQNDEFPFSLAGESDGECSLAVDIGWTSTRLLFVQGGEPRFCRVIADAGLQTLVRCLCERFEVLESEAVLLLRKIGVGALGKQSLVGPASEIHSCLAPVLVHLIAEIRRTLQFVKRQLPQQDPRSIGLFGGGAHVRYLSDHLSDQLKLSVRNWRLPSATGATAESSDGALAGAVALSLLAWEERPCR